MTSWRPGSLGATALRWALGGWLPCSTWCDLVTVMWMKLSRNPCVAQRRLPCGGVDGWEAVGVRRPEAVGFPGGRE
jgi:hypothetical protein